MFLNAQLQIDVVKSFSSRNCNKPFKKLVNQNFDSIAEMHIRKPRHLNCEHIETMPLIKFKKDKHVVALDKIDSGDHFKIVVTKWNFFLQMSWL